VLIVVMLSVVMMNVKAPFIANFYSAKSFIFATALISFRHSRIKLQPGWTFRRENHWENFRIFLKLKKNFFKLLKLLKLFNFSKTF